MNRRASGRQGGYRPGPGSIEPGQAPGSEPAVRDFAWANLDHRASVGVVGLGVGTVFGLKTSSTWSDAKTHCTGLECDRTGVQLATDAKNAGTISTIAFVAGAALLAGGAALFFTAPRGPAKNGAAGPVRLGVGLGSVTMQGSF